MKDFFGGNEDMRLLIIMMMVALLGGCATGTMTGAGQGGRAEDGRSYQEARADNQLAAAVNRALVRDTSVRATDIRVRARDGVITLSGYVPNPASAERAVKVVQQVDGVKAVVNHLHVSR